MFLLLHLAQKHAQVETSVLLFLSVDGHLKLDHSNNYLSRDSAGDGVVGLHDFGVHGDDVGGLFELELLFDLLN